jgi:hypothetical protein
MKRFATTLAATLLTLSQLASGSCLWANPGQPQASASPRLVLEDATPVRLRIAQTVSSESAHVGDRVEFEVLEEVRVGNLVVIPKGGIAWGTVTEAQPKRRMGRGGKLEIVMDSVRLADGEKAALRATKQAQGGSHTAAMTAGIVATGLIVWPAAPFFLFMHGKDITIPKGTEVPTFVNGDFPIDPAKFQPAATPGPPAPASAATPASPAPGQSAQVRVTSTPSGADILVDGNFLSNTPSTIELSAGEHTVIIRKEGYQDWSRKITVSGGDLNLTAELKPAAKPQN